jgi:GAF domain-containing protein
MESVSTLVHLHDVPASYRAFWNANGPIRPAPTTALGRLKHTKQVVHIPDLKDDEAYLKREPLRVVTVEQAGARSFLGAPMLKVKGLIGAIVIYRQAVRPFTDTQIQLLETFADQAVIAIENARLFNETKEALARQTATADVLKVISRSAFDLGSVMNTLTHSAAELCNAEIGALYLCEGDAVVARGVADADPAQAEFLRRTPLQNDSSTYVGRTILAGAIRNIADVANETEAGLLKKFSGALGFRSILFVPLMREGRGIGVFALARKRIGQFSTREVDLVQTFADQAVIAIENVRLFDEVQARTLELSEALAHQTASQQYPWGHRFFTNGLEPTLRATTKNLGSAVEIRIRDNGGGIPADVRAKMFDPFFTTKPAGEGTGLGLSMTYDIIVKQHGGRIDVETELGCFTEFIITLPRKKTPEAAGGTS